MPENKVFIDYANLPTPSEGFLATLFITVRKVARSRAFYTEVLGGQLVLEENPCMVKLSNSWIIMNPGGPPTPDSARVPAGCSPISRLAYGRPSSPWMLTRSSRVGRAGRRRRRRAC